jgi:TPR repeat protein
MYRKAQQSGQQSVSHIVSQRYDVRMLVLFISFILVMLPLMAKADGLFDFQMKLAKDGNAEAQFKVGEMYESGFGVKQDRKEAEIWINKAAAKGHETAGFKLLYWDVEKNGLKGDNKTKVNALIKKADDGNPQAQYYVGKMHANGVGMKKNPDKAIGWLNKAAFVGVLEAESELVLVREEKQRQALAERRLEEKKQAQLKAKQEQARLEEQRRLKAKSEADAKAKADAEAKMKQAEAAAREKAKQEEAKAKLLAQREAEARQREAQKQALLKQRAEQERQRKAQFESDPCSGKSARFLSTCK